MSFWAHYKANTTSNNDSRCNNSNQCDRARQPHVRNRACWDCSTSHPRSTHRKYKRNRWLQLLWFEFWLTLSLPRVISMSNSPAASPEILHHTVWRTWLFIVYSDERWLSCYLTHILPLQLKGWVNTLNTFLLRNWLFNKASCQGKTWNF